MFWKDDNRVAQLIFGVGCNLTTYTVSLAPLLDKVVRKIRALPDFLDRLELTADEMAAVRPFQHFVVEGRFDPLVIKYGGIDAVLKRVKERDSSSLNFVSAVTTPQYCEKFRYFP